jgi:hypothetical protein
MRWSVSAGAWTSGPLRSFLVLVQDRDPMIARGALEVFEPAVPVTREGAMSAAIGFGGGWIATFSPCRVWAPGSATAAGAGSGLKAPQDG